LGDQLPAPSAAKAECQLWAQKGDDRRNAPQRPDVPTAVIRENSQPLKVEDKSRHPKLLADVY
jgi:hypothetical protein